MWRQHARTTHFALVYRRQAGWYGQAQRFDEALASHADRAGEQQQRWLADIAAGDFQVAVALSEPGKMPPGRRDGFNPDIAAEGWCNIRV